MPLRDVVAMDGPSGTGKSTVAKAVADRMHLRYLDTGAMYRAVTWAVLAAGIDPEDADAVAALAETVDLEISTDPTAQRVTVGGRPVDAEIRTPAVTVAVSPVSAVPRVRTLLVDHQRRIIDDGGIVVEGRDIGTVVAPDAPLKVYLTASQDVRARRRATQDGTTSDRDVHATSADLLRRDTYDSSRAHSPLRAADDAVEVDTSLLSIDDVTEQLVDLAVKRGIGVRSRAGSGRD